MKRFTEEHTDKQYDIAVIGGGITGASIAYEAASRGLHVALLEKADFGAATSAATSKLIHGGLRYLKNLEFGLVRESLRERKTWANIAPNWVYPIPFLLPAYRQAKAGNLMLRMGMVLYDLLSYDKKRTWDSGKRLPNHKTISAQAVKRLEPMVSENGLNGGIVYYDCQNIFPERSTLAFVKSAMHHGADVANYAEVTGFLKDSKGTIQGVQVHDKETGREQEVRARLVVNSAGTWADKILNLGQNTGHHTIKRSEGIHIVTPKINNDHAVALVTEEGRHFMIMPWREYSLIGTTDKPYHGDPDSYQVSRESIQELLDHVNRYYGAKKLTLRDVHHAYGGLRPLVDDQTEEVYESSRKYEIADNAKDGMEGLITTEGGKYTTSRNLAEKTVDLAARKLQRPVKKSPTARQYLYGSEIKDMELFVKNLRSRYKHINPTTVEYLARNYGTEASQVLDMAEHQADLHHPLTHDGEILAQVRYALQEEMSRHLDDVMLRRTGLGTLGRPSEEVLQEAADMCASHLGWNQAEKKEEIRRFLQTYAALENNE